MNESPMYEIRIGGRIAAHWSDWLGGLALDQTADDETILRGRPADQAALFGILNKIHSLNLPLLAVIRLPPDGGSGTNPGDGGPPEGPHDSFDKGDCR